MGPLAALMAARRCAWEELLVAEQREEPPAFFMSDGVKSQLAVIRTAKTPRRFASVARENFELSEPVAGGDAGWRPGPPPFRRGCDAMRMAGSRFNPIRLSRSSFWVIMTFWGFSHSVM